MSVIFYVNVNYFLSIRFLLEEENFLQFEGSKSTKISEIGHVLDLLLAEVCMRLRVHVCVCVHDYCCSVIVCFVLHVYTRVA